MARRINVNEEPYAGFLPETQIPQCNPTNTFHTTDARCKRYCCAVCGECHPVTASQTQRLTEWLTGVSLPDALHRSTEAKLIDDYTQTRFRQAREIDNNPCTIAQRAIDKINKSANAFHPC
ncbi:unnamed protein product [Echinostoma caproni]|uniref:4Fe-4S ferredoxin-type domain-containing protein n=1 Tax=Echinostoma caproni TaxID=27848 RepID=A0A182ZZY0_9TREM|nr:unnamed protein product [Echinostoma caproni]